MRRRMSMRVTKITDGRRNEDGSGKRRSRCRGKERVRRRRRVRRWWRRRRIREKNGRRRAENGRKKK